MTDTLFVPVTRFNAPITSVVAFTCVVVERTVTAVVNAATSIVCPSITDTPFTVMVARVASFENVFPCSVTNTFTV